MVTERLPKHYHRECCKKYLSLGEREGGRARPWSSDFGGLMHIQKKHTQIHTQLELGSCCKWWKVSIGQFAGHTHVPGTIKDVTLANNCLQHFCYLIFAELTGWDNYITLLLDPYHLVSWACRDSKVFCLSCTTLQWHGGLCHPAHHLPSASGTSVLQGCSSGALCEIEMCLQSFTPSSQIFGWLLCGTWTCPCTVLCALALGRDFTPLYPAAASQLSRDPHWASVSPWLWNILSWKDHRSFPPHL